MKIAVIGAQCTGKSTYIEDFISNWSSYSKCSISKYSDQVKEKGLTLNESGTEASQKQILSSLADQVIYTSKENNTIFDRSVLDNLVYTMWLNANSRVSDDFVRETIKVVKETLVFYDILFFLPITKQSPVPFEPGSNRSESAEYRIEIDNIFKALIHQYNTGDKTYFPFNHDLGCPGIVEIYGDRQQRIELTKLYINPSGDQYTDEDTLLNLTPEELEAKQYLEDISSNKNIQPSNTDIIIPSFKKKK